MAWMIGVDEAGYGPNLGPLVVAATAWRCLPGIELPKQRARSRKLRASAASAQSPGLFSSPALAAPPFTPPDLYRVLSPHVAAAPEGDHLAVADSKQLYKPGAGVRLLERGVLAALACTRVDEAPTAMARWSELVAALEADPNGAIASVPWHDGFDAELPAELCPEDLAKCAERLGAACEQRCVAPPLVRARLVFPEEFNALCEEFGTKGAALSHVSLALVRRLLDSIGATPSLLRSPATGPAAAGGDEAPATSGFHTGSATRLAPICDGAPVAHCLLDKHGGRHRYGALVQHHFPEHWVEPVVESRGESRYAWGPAEERVELAFCARGESFMPTALASMMAKYLRELAMKAFNAYWITRLPGLRPTAGYPNDARRFRAEIAALQQSLGMTDAVLWRSR